MKDFLLDILCNPVTQQPLFYAKEEEKILDQCQEFEYECEEGVPIIMRNLPSGSEFDYIRHYENDARYFDYFNPGYTPATRHENRRLHEYILSNISSDNKLVLDLGCGSAWLARQLCPKGHQIISMDISRSNTAKALKQFPHKNHAALVADAMTLPLKNQSLDCIVACEILEHIQNPKELIYHLILKLKKGSKLIITTPYNEKIEQNLCIHCHKLTPRHAHLHSFQEKNIAQLIPENVNWRVKKFSNKYLTKLRSHIFLQYLPFSVWRLIDRCWNKLFPIPTRILILITNS